MCHVFTKTNEHCPNCGSIVGHQTSEIDIEINLQDEENKACERYLERNKNQESINFVRNIFFNNISSYRKIAKEGIPQVPYIPC